GTAGLPHILIRFYTVPDSMTPRSSVSCAIVLIGTFSVFTLGLGFGAAAIVGHQAITSQDSAGNAAAPQLAQAVGSHFGGETIGAILLALIASVAFATILSTVAGLVIASSSSLAMTSRSEERTSELQSRFDLVCRLLLEKKKNTDHMI